MNALIEIACLSAMCYGIYRTIDWVATMTTEHELLKIEVAKMREENKR